MSPRSATIRGWKRSAISSSVPRREFALLADPDQQAALLEGYLRQLPHDQTVVEFTGNTSADLAIAILAGFNWLVQCAVQAGADPKEFLGALRNFRKVASSAQKWWAMDGAKERYAEMLAAKAGAAAVLQSGLDRLYADGERDRGGPRGEALKRGSVGFMRWRR